MDHMKKTNKFVLTILTIIDMFLIVGYLQDASKSNISMTFGIVASTVVGVTLVVDYISYFMKKNSPMFKHITIIGYIAVYALLILNAKNDVVFAILYPIYVMYVLYFDTRLMSLAGGTLVLINLASVVQSIVRGHMPSGLPVEVSSMLLQLATVIVTVIALTWVTSLEKIMKKEQMDSIENEKNKSLSLLRDVLNLGNQVKDNSNRADAIINELNDATLTTLESMKAVAVSNTENAKNIENQTVMTGNIQPMNWTNIRTSTTDRYNRLVQQPYNGF